MFGLGDEGVVYHTSIRDTGSKRKPDDWQRIGNGVAGSLSAFALPDGSVGVFALARDGQVLHRRLRRNQWTPKGQEFSPSARPTGNGSSSCGRSKKGVGLATLAEYGVFQYLAWPDYPQGEPARRLASGGTIDAWLEARPPRVHSTGQRDSGREQRPQSQATAAESCTQIRRDEVRDPLRRWFRSGVYESRDEQTSRITRKSPERIDQQAITDRLTQLEPEILAKY